MQSELMHLYPLLLIAKVDFSHLAIVEDTTGLCGLDMPRKRLHGVNSPEVSLDLNCLVAVSLHLTGQRRVS